MGHSFSYKNHRIDIDVAEAADHFDWSFRIDSGEPVRVENSEARTSAAAVLAAMAAAKKAVDRLI